MSKARLEQLTLAAKANGWVDPTEEWQNRIVSAYASLFAEFGIPDIPLVFSEEYEDFVRVVDRYVFKTDGRFQIHQYTKSGLHPEFYFPYNREDLDKYAEKTFGKQNVAFPDLSPEFIMAHEFWHFLRFLSVDFKTLKQLDAEYKQAQSSATFENSMTYSQEEVEANDFAKAYEEWLAAEAAKAEAGNGLSGGDIE